MKRWGDRTLRGRWDNTDVYNVRDRLNIKVSKPISIIVYGLQNNDVKSERLQNHKLYCSGIHTCSKAFIRTKVDISVVTLI